jgi:hypothetical protein
MTKKPEPLVIFVGEQHDNMAYGSLVENLIKYIESIGLNVQIFSEYKSQTQKIGMETALRNQATDPLAFEETTKFLDSRFIKMGDLAKREEIMAESLQRYKDQGFTPRQLFEQTKPQMVVAPEIYGMMESDLRDGESTGSVNGKPFNLDNFYHSYRAQFNHGAVHSAMLNDLRTAINVDTDVVVVVSGLGHTYGLNQELSEFEGCQKLVITNFLDNIITDPTRRGEIKKAESSAQIGIGGLLEFDVDPITKIASIPDIAREKLDEKSLTKKQSFEPASFVEKLGLQKPDETPRSFVKAMQAGKYGNIGSKGGAREL